MLSSWLPFAGLALTAGSVQLARLQLRDGYEHRFVERFWILEDARLERKYSERTTGPIEHEKYLRLCEDEYEAMGLGGVSFRTWEVWHSAVRDCLNDGDDRRVALEGLAKTEYELVRKCLDHPLHSSGHCPALAARQRLLGRTRDLLTRRSIQ